MLDIVALRAFISATKKHHNRIAIFCKVNPEARPKMQSEFLNTLSNTLVIP